MKNHLHQLTIRLSISGIIAAIFLLQAGCVDENLATPSGQSTQKMTVAQMERRLEQIDSELETLAQYGFQSGVGSIGFRSQTHESPDALEWVQIELSEPQLINEVVLVPTILRHAKLGFVADALPIEFRVIAGTSDSNVEDKSAPPKGTVLASFSANDRLTPRVAPLVINCENVKASWVRVEASKLASRQYDGKYLLQLAEILVFSGSTNIAKSQPVHTSSNVPSGSPAWDERFVVDGFVPYVMNKADEDGTNAFVSGVGIGDHPAIIVDLEKEESISEIRLHLVDQGDTVPQTFSGDFGVPASMVIEGANNPDFSDGKMLVEYQHNNAYDIGPIISLGFPTARCRYVRVVASDPYRFSFEEHDGTRIGFAEIEILKNGRNIAQGKKPTAILGPEESRRSLEALTDGKNRYGQILPILDWHKQLARRHDLEREQPLVTAALTSRFRLQRANLNRLIGLSILLALGTIAALYVGWNMRQRAVQRTRERIAADLHDEIGANYHAIGLLSDLAQESSESPEKLEPLLKRIRELTERTGTATAYCANLLESVGLFDDLELDMRHASDRIIADLDHEIIFEGEKNLQRLSARKRIDLFLFYKECLTNILRHSKATNVSTKLTSSAKELCLQISDNGHGIQESFANGVPPSLRRRARLLGAVVIADQSELGGTKLELKLRLSNSWPFSLFS